MSSFRAIYLNNPDGRAFAFTAHRYMWPTRWEGDGHVSVFGPEQWFNPQTGRPAPVVQYDFHLGPAQRTSETFCAPCPLLGDTDTGMRGAHAVYLNNPENRPFDFCVTGYILPPGAYIPVQFRASGPADRELGQAESEFTHRTREEPSLALISVPAAGAGVYKVNKGRRGALVRLERADHGHGAGRQSHRRRRGQVSLMLALGRHWFFGVPEGTKEFLVRVDLADPNHALHVEVNGPDRIVQVLYAYGGAPQEVRVPVPEGLDGKVWFLNLSVGSATRLLGQGAQNRRTVQVDADIELHGVPGYIAPTWEQWFNPEEVD